LKGVLASALSENTRRAYEKAWRTFAEYCADNGIDPLSANPDTVANFLVEAATTPSSSKRNILAMSSVRILLCGVNRRFLDAGQQSPASHPKVAAVMKGLQRILGAPPRQVKALREGEVLRMIDQCDSSLMGLRDSAILALGFSAALRRSEICDLNISDLQLLTPMVADGEARLFLTIRKSKTDQTSQGQRVAIPDGKHIRPVSRLKSWLQASGVSEGRVFRSLRRGGKLRGPTLHHSDIPRIVKKYAQSIGLDASEYAGHSLRAGFVTSAAAHHAQLHKIMEVTRHTNPSTVMKYIRHADAFMDHAGRNFL